MLQITKDGRQIQGYSSISLYHGKSIQKDLIFKMDVFLVD